MTPNPWWIWYAGAFVLGLVPGSFIAWLITRLRGERERKGLEIQIAELQARIQAEQEKTEWAAKTDQQWGNTFEALASQALRTNSEEFAKKAGDLVSPLTADLGKLDTYIRELEQKREGAYTGVTEKLDQLARTHGELQSTTTTLATALKSPTVRGRWGEIQLRRVVEMAGMTKHVDFSEQPAGSSGRPDMIVRLPNGRIVPVDAKVPMTSYLEAMEIREESLRTAKLQDHAKAIRARVRELSGKEYWKQFDSSLDFVVMFIPNEACVGAAFECDCRLLEDATERRVLITTPVTFFALITAIAYGWQEQQLADNAREIAQHGQEFYSRLQVFLKHIEKLGSSLNSSVNEYNEMVGSLERRLLPSAREFRELGIATSALTAPARIDHQASAPRAAIEEP